MAERNYYVIREDRCLFPAMSKEQIIAAIAEATGTIPSGTDIDSGFITKIQEQNKNVQLKFWRGSQAEYNALEEKDNNTHYIVIDDTFRDDTNNSISTLSNNLQLISASTQTKPVEESYTIQASSWVSDGGIAPFKVRTSVNATATLGDNDTVELINDNAILFVTSGIAIGAINNQTITFYAQKAPTAACTLSVQIWR